MLMFLNANECERAIPDKSKPQDATTIHMSLSFNLFWPTFLKSRNIIHTFWLRLITSQEKKLTKIR